MAIAHALIEVGDSRYERGHDVPDDLAGIDELRDGGAVSDEEYVEPEYVVQPPETIVIDGVTYVQSSDGANTGEARS